MEISDGKLGALVFHLARPCPEALLLPMRDGAGNITLCGWEAHGGCISQSGHGPVDLSASGLGLSDTTSHRWIYHPCLELRACKRSVGLHFLYGLNTATSADCPQPLRRGMPSSRRALLVSTFMLKVVRRL